MRWSWRAKARECSDVTKAGRMSKEFTIAHVATDPAIPLEEAIHSNSDDVLNAAAIDPALTLDLALALLKRTDLTAQVVEQLGKNSKIGRAHV